MPLSSSASYVSTTEAILAHWRVADETLGAGNEIIVWSRMTHGTVSRDVLQIFFDLLVAKRSELAAKLNLVETVRGEIDLLKAALLLRINQFNELVRAKFAGSKWQQTLADVPNLGNGEELFTTPLEVTATLWQLMDADPATEGPLTLLGNYERETFVTDLEALKAAFARWHNAGLIARLTLLERNQFQEIIQSILANYRQQLPTKFPKRHPLVDSLPALYPAPSRAPSNRSEPVEIEA